MRLSERFDGGPTYMVLRSAAVDGNRPFAESMVNGKVDPTVRRTIVERQDRPAAAKCAEIPPS